MPRIEKGHQKLPDEPTENSGIILALYSIPNEGGLGGYGLTTFTDIMAACLEKAYVIKTGAFLRQYYQNNVLSKDIAYTDNGFDLWRQSLSHEELQSIDEILDSEVALNADKLASLGNIVIVDSKLFWPLQQSESELKDKIPHVKSTIIGLGFITDEDTSAKRVIEREATNGKTITMDEARHIRQKRLEIDQENIKILYPELSYNQDFLTNIAHYVIDNSDDVSIKEIYAFVEKVVRTIAGDIAESLPELSHTLIAALCQQPIEEFDYIIP